MSDLAPEPPQRLVTLDFMRGVAVLGILTMNIVGFAWPEPAVLAPNAPLGPRGPFDEAVFLVEFVLFDGKMRGLFSLLFGASMALLVGRAETAGEDALAVQHRRLAWLAAFGLAHFYLLWWGDILFLYAVCGFFAFALVDWPARRLLVVGIVIYAASALWLGGLSMEDALPWLGGDEAAKAEAAARIARSVAEEGREELRATLGPWPSLVAYRVASAWDWPFATVLTSGLETVALMLIGMGLLRGGLFFAGSWPIARARKLAFLAILFGLAATLPLAAWLAATGYALPVARFVTLSLAAPGRLGMTLGYAAMLVVITPRVASTALGVRIVAAGKLAFSNYLGTSLVMAALFQGWGLGLFARYSRIELLIFVVLGWALMLLWSKPWLARFRRGPLEALWRRLALGHDGSFGLATAKDSH